MNNIIPTPVANPTSTAGSSGSGLSGIADIQMIASNFTTFLQLLTTQLKNQNPLDPLDINQFANNWCSLRKSNSK